MRRIFQGLVLWVAFGASVPACVWGQDSAVPPAQGSTGQSAGAELHQRPPAPSYQSDPKFQKALAEAKEPKQTVDDRLGHWKKANKIAQNQCVECLHQMLFWQMDKSQWKDAVASATQLDLVATEPKDKFFAEVERGIALLHSNDNNPKPDQLKDAEVSLHAALAIAPHSKDALYSEGRALALLGRFDEAKATFQRYVDVAKISDRYRMRAEHFVDDPHLAAMQMAPPFTLTTSEGEELTLDDMGGKVVLLDFWATWCGPCKETLPEIQRIAKDFAGQPLIVISVSSDQDEMAWKTFTAKNNMTWPQYRDGNHELQDAYGVSSIPRFFTIDTDGVLQSVKVGSDANVRGDIKKLVGKALDAEKKKALASEKTSGQ